MSLEPGEADALRGKFWPRGAPADPGEAFAALKVSPAAFLGNISGSARWLHDGRALLDASTPGADRRLLDRLRAKKHAELSGAPERALAGLHTSQRGNGWWPVRPIALHASGRGQLLARFALLDGQAVLDVDAELARLVDACLGGWDRACWLGTSHRDVLCAFKGGREAAFVAGYHINSPWMKGWMAPIPPENLLVGADGTEPLRGPVWASPPTLPPGPAPWPETQAHVARLLGAAPDRWRGLAWAAPTRAGILRFGHNERFMVGVFDEPLRAFHMPLPRSFGDYMPAEINERSVGQRDDLYACGAALWRSPRRLWEALVDQGLLLAPEARPPAHELEAAPVPPLGPRFESLHWPYEDTKRIFDVERGVFLPGKFTGYGRPFDLARRLTAAAALRGDLP